MPIKKRIGGDKGGVKRSPLIRRKTSISRTINRQPEGELAEVVKLWQANSPGTMRKLTETVSYGRVSTGILTLDLCLAGGFLRSRCGMIYGERSAGKSTLLARTLANAQKAEPDSWGVVIDIEGTADKAWMERQGVDTERVMLVEPGTGEDAVDQTDALLRTEQVCFIGLDSVAMVTPFKEIDSSAEDNQIGLQARLIGKMLRRVNNALLQERRREHHPLLMLLNQFRMKAGLAFGDPRTLPGGKALEFATSQQVEARNKEIKDKDGIVIFNEHTCVISKDKTGGRLKEAKFKMIRDESQDLPVGYVAQAGSILEFGEKIGLVTGRYEVDGFRHKFRGRDDFQAYLVEHPAEEALICHKIVMAYRKKWGVEV